MQLGNIGPREEVKGIHELTVDEIKERFDAYKEKLLIARQNFEFGTIDDLTWELKLLKREYQKRTNMNTA